MILIPFLLSLFAAIFGSVFFPKIHLIAFAPFLAIVFTRKNFVTSLWLACLCGLIIDLLSSQFRFGMHGLNYCLTTILIYHQRKHFFEEKTLALCLFTALVSAVSTTLQFFLLSAFDAGFNFSWSLIVTDFILMSILDGIYAFLWFVMPLKCIQFIRKNGFKFKLLFRKSQNPES